MDKLIVAVFDSEKHASASRLRPADRQAQASGRTDEGSRPGLTSICSVARAPLNAEGRGHPTSAPR